MVGSQPAWRLVADARWQPRRVYPTPWAVAAITPTDDLVVLNLAAVDIAHLPAGVVRSLQLQAHQFCSTTKWSRTARTPAAMGHDGQLLIGTHKIPVKQPLSTPEEIFGIECGKTFHDLSPKRRRIAQLLDTSGGLTLEELTEHFTTNPSRRRAVKNSLHTELSRMRSHPNITISHHNDGRYTISRITTEKPTPDHVSHC
ncbi:hypothetical protein [Mycobacterium talmoniae]|uniref:hypothetical protein n=1 Tax=Mycobacterium talmoniae TaxID=1858794 RepID=UPI001058D577|nr:hypothetical protein [Mycobacterium talmoniae]